MTREGQGWATGPAPMVTPWVDLGAWVGWLIRAHRVVVQPGPPSAAFVAQLAEAGFAADASFVAAGESGQVWVPQEMIAAYERVLALPSGQLISVCGGARYALAGRVQPAQDLSRSQVIDQLAGVDARIGAQAATGVDWLTLAQLAEGPHPVMLPPRLARTWTGQLLDEMVRSVRSARTTRLQALCRLVRNPQTRDAVVEAVFDLAATPGAAGVGSALGVLGADADADPVLVERLIITFDKGGAPASRGAATALLTPVAQGRLSPDQRARIGRVILARCRDLPQQAEPAVVLAAGMSRDLARQAIHRVGDDPRALCNRRLPSTGMKAYLTAAHRHTGATDPVLARLLHEVLIGHYPWRRHHALRLLEASPYRSALADAALEVTATSDDPVATSIAGMALPYLAGPAQQPVLLGLLAGSCWPVHPDALRALAQATGVPHWFSLRRDLREPTTRASAVFAAGMSGHPDLKVAAAAAPARADARWWLHHGAAIRDTRTQEPRGHSRPDPGR